MHRLHLLRHAKASRDSGYEDQDRPLARRGRTGARLVGEKLARLLEPVDLVLCSSSVRTRETADLLLAAFNPRPAVRFEDELYLASANALLRRLRQLDEACTSVMVIGHNPGLHELAVALAAGKSAQYADLANGKFPTAAVASFAVEGEWVSLERGNNFLTAYATPKSLGIED
jgi:phosphohistidine phosphatase